MGDSTPHPFAVALAEYAGANRLFDSENDEEAYLLVALSGGPDSTALLLALQEARNVGLAVPASLSAAHFHHALRGVDADEDAAFAASLCARLGIPCTVELGIVSSDKRLSPQDAARRARYIFLEKTARHMGATHIVTAHTADDQAETVMLRVLRGTGVDGLSGIPVRRNLASGLVVIRPILGARRTEVEAYCRDRGVTPRHDPSNVKDKYARSRLRKRLPELAEAFNPRLTEALGRLASNAATDADLLGSLAESLWVHAASFEPGSIRLNAAALRVEHSAIRRRVLLRALRHISEGTGSEEETATSSWVDALERMIEAGQGRVSLPGDIRAEMREEGGSLSLSLPPVPTKPEEALAAIPLPIHGSVFWRTATISAYPCAEGDEPAQRVRRARTVDIALDIPIANASLLVRSARIGERMAPLGMGGKTRLIRDLLSDAGIVAEDRPYAPVIARADTSEILWLVGVAQAESTRIHPSMHISHMLRLNVVAPASEDAV